MRSTVRASYSKDEEKKYNDRAIGAGFTQYGFGNAIAEKIKKDWKEIKAEKTTFHCPF